MLYLSEILMFSKCVFAILYASLALTLIYLRQTIQTQQSDCCKVSHTTDNIMHSQKLDVFVFR